MKRYFKKEGIILNNFKKKKIITNFIVSRKSKYDFLG